jgi:tRNA-dihydrouridine synthase B
VQFLVVPPAGKLSIGGRELPSRAFLAPMAGITDAPMRRLAERYGAGWVVTEMIASNALATGHGEMVRKLRAAAGRLPHVVQLAGCEDQWMRRGAGIAAEAGADIIDINMGCPNKRVTNGLAGSALMRVPDEALRLIEAVVSATPLPVTLKMRLGWDEQTLNAAQLARRAVEAGVSMVTVHARTRQQFYKGEARWHLVRAIVEAVDVPVAVNGDISDTGTATAALRESGAAAVMVGRGAQGQPWIVGQIGAALAGAPVRPTPEGDELAALVAGHYEDMLVEYGTQVGIRAARKHLGWYLDAAAPPVEARVRRALLSGEDPAAVIAGLLSVFAGGRRLAA